MPRGTFDLDPEELRALGYGLVDRVVQAIEEERDDPVFPTVNSEQLHADHAAGLPREALPADQYGEMLASLLGEARRKNGHPRFFGYVCSAADPLAVLADLAISASNQNTTAWRSAPGACELERQVLRWLDELVGFDAGGEGVLTSGGSLANLTALATAALNSSGPRERMLIYTSTETHFSVRKAARVLGVEVRVLATDAQRRMRVEALRESLEQDRAAGLQPVCVVATAGSTNTGAIDPLQEIALVTRTAGVWLHVDGAYGAPAACTDSHAWMRDGLALADSLSIDPHKWLFAPFDVGALLMRDGAAARRAFDLTDEYARVVGKSEIERHTFYLSTPELSRRARAAKVWTILRGRGADSIREELERQIELREFLDRRVAEESRLEGLGSGLSVACFRYRCRDADKVNEAIREALCDSGHFLLSPTSVSGRVALRICIVNFRTQRPDLEELVQQVLKLGAALE